MLHVHNGTTLTLYVMRILCFLEGTGLLVMCCFDILQCSTHKECHPCVLFVLLPFMDTVTVSLPDEQQQAIQMTHKTADTAAFIKGQIGYANSTYACRQHGPRHTTPHQSCLAHMVFVCMCVLVSTTSILVAICKVACTVLLVW